MIKSISIITPLGKNAIAFDKEQKQKIVLDIAQLNIKEYNSFDIEITFTVPISEFRNHDYTWVKFNVDRVANTFSPKILKLQNNMLVQANINSGIWEINKKDKKVLLWRFNPELSSPITHYSGDSNKRIISNARNNWFFDEMPSLLFTQKNALEYSRSKIAFSPVVCFTDHCDFDTAENLPLQRNFFKENNVKTTKGFFLNHFSKRQDNASFQNEFEELTKWKEDGHELCYHSLSQSIKSPKESQDDFTNFIPPFSDIPTWIDHGYQPYNFSLFENNNIKDSDFENILIDKKINILWNYIDSGTATAGVINQFNSQHFTLSSFLRGNKDLPLVKKMQLMIKNIIFHYYNDEELILKYKSTADNFKKIVFQKKLKYLLSFVSDFLKLSYAFFSVFTFWNTTKNKPYKLAKYNPILFKHRIYEKDFFVFQTLEMLDFKKALSQENINLLMKESGVFIAHTYFSVPMEYHRGKLFSTASTIDKTVSENFKLLGNKIQNKEIWNPTLRELIEYWTRFEKVLLDIDLEGNIFEKNNSDLQIRKVI